MSAQALAALVLAGWLALLPPTLLRHRRHAGWFAGVAAAVGAALLGLWLVGPEGLPTRRLLLLREGREEAIVEALWTADPWIGHPWRASLVPLRGVVWAHLAQATVAAGLLACLARVAAGRAAAVVVTAGLVGSAWFEHAAWSSGPEAPLTLLALVAWQAASMADAPWRPVRALAVATVAAAGALAATTRTELALVALPLVLVALASALGVGGRWRARHLDAPAWARLAALPLASSALLALGATTLQARGVHRGLSHAAAFPWTADHLATLRLPLDLLALASPGFALLVLLGLGVAALRSASGLLLATALVLLVRVYALEEHLGAAPYETLRHAAMIQGGFAIAACAGAAAVSSLPRARLAWAALALLTLAPRALAPEGLGRFPGRPLEATQQVGLRFALEVAEAFPRCVLVSRLAPDVLAREGDQHAWTFRFETVLHGLPVLPVTATRDAAWVAEHVRRRGLDRATPLELPETLPAELRDAPCVVALRGLDCNLNGADCDAWLGDLPPLLEVELPGVPEYNTHHGGHASPLRLGAYGWAR